MSQITNLFKKGEGKTKKQERKDKEGRERKKENLKKETSRRKESKLRKPNYLNIKHLMPFNNNLTQLFNNI